MSRPRSPRLRDIEAQAGIGASTLIVHTSEDWYVDIDVVVDLNASLVLGRTEDPPDVLDNVPLEPDGEGEEQCVEWRAVEALANETGRSTKDQPGTHFGGRPQLVHNRGSSFLTHLPVHH